MDLRNALVGFVKLRKLTFGTTKNPLHEYQYDRLESAVMAWEAIEYFTYLAGLVHYSLLFYMVLVPTTLLLITWLCISNAREI